MIERTLLKCLNESVLVLKCLKEYIFSTEMSKRINLGSVHHGASTNGDETIKAMLPREFNCCYHACHIREKFNFLWLSISFSTKISAFE